MYSKKSFQKDRHVTDLLVFPPGTDLHAHKLLLDGSIILQVRFYILCTAYFLNIRIKQVVFRLISWIHLKVPLSSTRVQLLEIKRLI